MRASSSVVALWVSSCLLVMSSSALAAKPDGGGSGGGGKNTTTSLPAVTPNYDFAAFEWRPDLGGVHDKTRNIVWGYSLAGVTNGNITHINALPADTWYAQMFATHAQNKQNDGNLLLSLAEVETDPIRKAKYEADAADCFEAVPILQEAGNIASQYNNWRLPTLAEARDVTSRGLFTQGATGLNMWTGSPVDETPTLPYSGWRSTWCSDTSTVKVQGSAMAWYFYPINGEAFIATRTSGLDCIVVRNYTPTP